MRRSPLVVAALLLLAACGQVDLYVDQSERHANEMVAILRSNGIEASKRVLPEAKDPDHGWAVTTPEGDFPRATRLLGAQGYPRQQSATLGSVFKKEGFVSSPFEERARLNYALAQELEHSISLIDGVTENHVVVTQPERDPLSDVVRPASASVVIRHRPGTGLEGQVGQIRAMMVDAVEGLAPERVTILLSAPAPLSLPTTSQSSLGGLGEGLRTLLIPVVVVILIAIGWPRVRRWQLHRRTRRLPAE